MTPESRPPAVFVVDFENVCSILNTLNSSFPCGRKARFLFIICIFFNTINFVMYKQPENKSKRRDKN